MLGIGVQSFQPARHSVKRYFARGRPTANRVFVSRVLMLLAVTNSEVVSEQPAPDVRRTPSSRSFT
jgi:hypothetical protein